MATGPRVQFTNKLNSGEIPEQAYSGYGLPIPTVINNSVTGLQIRTASNPILGTSVGGPLIPESGQYMEIYGLKVGCNKKVGGYISFNDDPTVNGNANRLLYSKCYMLEATGRMEEIQVRFTLKTNQVAQFRCNVAFDTLDADDVVFRGSWLGFSLSACNTIEDARWLLKPIGDSITHGTGSTNTAPMWHTQLWNLLLANGVSVAYDFNGFPGLNSTGFLNSIPSGRFDAGNKPTIYALALGVNDAAQNVPVATTKATMKSYVLRYLLNPLNTNSMCWLFGPTPQENPIDEAKGVDVRAAYAEINTEIMNNFPALYERFAYVDLGTNAFTDGATARKYYFTEDPANNGIHPNDSGLSEIYTRKIVPFFTQTQKGQDIMGKLTSR